MIGYNKFDQSYDEFTETSREKKGTFIVVEGNLKLDHGKLISSNMIENT